MEFPADNSPSFAGAYSSSAFLVAIFSGSPVKITLLPNASHIGGVFPFFDPSIKDLSPPSRAS